MKKQIVSKKILFQVLVFEFQLYKHDFATAKCFVMQQFSRSGSLFPSDGWYVGYPVDRLFLSIVLSTLRPLGVMNLDL
jgi:hypothetical protein